MAVSKAGDGSQARRRVRPAEFAPWFDPTGPQYEVLVAEATELADDPLGPPAYSVVMSDPVAHSTESEVRVDGRVVFARTGEPSQLFRWRVVARPHGGSWRIWTVEDLAP